MNYDSQHRASIAASRGKKNAEFSEACLQLKDELMNVQLLHIGCEYNKQPLNRYVKLISIGPTLHKVNLF